MPVLPVCNSGDNTDVSLVLGDGRRPSLSRHKALVASVTIEWTIVSCGTLIRALQFQNTKQAARKKAEISQRPTQGGSRIHRPDESISRPNVAYSAPTMVRQNGKNAPALGVFAKGNRCK